MIQRILVLLALLLPAVSQAQTMQKPLILPFQDPPGAGTWLLGQAYGNTTGAYNFGDAWYRAGQGLHFGLDFSAPCGTALVAVADGVVAFVDDLGFGSAPHNLILRHEALGLTTLYGHLRERSPLTAGETVVQGQFVGYSGDPDNTCDSRPHLHLEIRTLDYFTALNPVDYIDADWNSLALIGSFGDRFFQMDLENTRRWVSLDDQPNVSFGGQRLNAYRASLPLPQALQAPVNPLLARAHNPLTEQSTVTLRPLDTTNCCWETWWHPIDPNILFSIDGAANTRAQVALWDANSTGLSATLGEAPAPHHSPDYTHSILPAGNTITIQNLLNGESWQVQTGGAVPSMNPGNTHLLWINRAGTSVPGQDAPMNTIFISDARGTQVETLFSEAGINAMWLDAERLLLTRPHRPYTQLDVYHISERRSYALGRWYRPRGFSVSPGGSRLIFYLAGQPIAAENGIYWMEIAEGAVPQRVDWFGAYRWRDVQSLYYIPFEPGQMQQQIWYYEPGTGTRRQVSQQGITILNGAWSVNADGNRILYRNAADRNLWLMEIAP